MTQENQIKPVEVTQEDREAAAPLFDRVGGSFPTRHDVRHDVLTGTCDEGPTVQAFARHRLNTRISPGETARELLENEVQQDHYSRRLRDEDVLPRLVPFDIALRAIERALSSPSPTAPLGDAALPENDVVGRANRCEGMDPDKFVQISVKDLRAAAMAVCQVQIAPLSSTPSNIRDQARQGGTKAAFLAGYKAAQHDGDKPAYAIGLDPAGDAWEEYIEARPAEGAE